MRLKSQRRSAMRAAFERNGTCREWLHGPTVSARRERWAATVALLAFVTAISGVEPARCSADIVGELQGDQGSVVCTNYHPPSFNDYTNDSFGIYRYHLFGSGSNAPTYDSGGSVSFDVVDGQATPSNISFNRSITASAYANGPDVGQPNAYGSGASGIVAGVFYFHVNAPTWFLFAALISLSGTYADLISIDGSAALISNGGYFSVDGESPNQDNIGLATTGRLVKTGTLYPGVQYELSCGTSAAARANANFDYPAHQAFESASLSAALAANPTLVPAQQTSHVAATSVNGLSANTASAVYVDAGGSLVLDAAASAANRQF